MTDPIADMLARIRNATLARHTRVDMPSSRLKVEIAKILQNEGYIQGFSVLEPQAGERVTAQLRVFLKYGPRGERVITGIRRVSKPGLRVYTKADAVPRVLGGLGVAVAAEVDAVYHCGGLVNFVRSYADLRAANVRGTETVVRLAPSFGGVNLEDIAAPNCFYVEEELKKRVDIPIFHDDQHGTAVVTLAALVNSLKIVG